MATLDLRRSLNAISDVVNSRPRPLREFDQIFMKTADMLLQTDHVGRLFKTTRYRPNSTTSLTHFRAVEALQHISLSSVEA